MNGFIADKITNLSAARYFAARGADWLFFDPQAGSGLSLRQMLAIKEWVEGPQCGLYLALGADSIATDMHEHFQPDGVMLGHFAALQGIPANLTIFKEWCPEVHSDPTMLVSWIEATAQADHHLIRLEDWSLEAIRSLGSTFRTLSSAHSLFLSTRLPSQEWSQLLDMDLPLNYCFSSPAEEQVGLLAVEDLDGWIDTLEERM
ncbi:MAG: hypothetical protein KA479_05805 [Saprospiraceae bacterium]|nr:hypothetical protein [Saprospiraceae bacterium]